MDSLFEVFTCWEPIYKARKAKGLDNWSSLSHLAGKLKGKGKKEITFTCGHPSHPGEKHILGSVLGNLHFLMGYGNPAFHFAPYHWQIIDPSVEEEEVEELHHLRGHPSRMEFWERSGLDVEDEGDQDEGEPHPEVADVLETKRKKASRDAESITVTSGIGRYTGVPSEGLVYGEHNDHVYKWEMVKNSFLAAAHPDLAEAMNVASEEFTEKEERVDKSLITDYILDLAKSQGEFDYSVFPLVKAKFPAPGSVVPLSTLEDETIYGVVTSKSVDFLDREGAPVFVQVYDREYSSFDLRKSGNIHPSIIYNFGVNYLNIQRDDVEQFVGGEEGRRMGATVVKGRPTPGFESLEEDQIDSLVKSVERVGNTYRLVLKESE